MPLAPHTQNHKRIALLNPREYYLRSHSFLGTERPLLLSRLLLTKNRSFVIVEGIEVLDAHRAFYGMPRANAKELFAEIFE